MSCNQQTLRHHTMKRHHEPLCEGLYELSLRQPTLAFAYKSMSTVDFTQATEHQQSPQHSRETHLKPPTQDIRTSHNLQQHSWKMTKSHHCGGPGKGMKGNCRQANGMCKTHQVKCTTILSSGEVCGSKRLKDEKCRVCKR